MGRSSEVRHNSGKGSSAIKEAGTIDISAKGAGSIGAANGAVTRGVSAKVADTIGSVKDSSKGEKEA